MPMIFTIPFSGKQTSMSVLQGMATANRDAKTTREVTIVLVGVDIASIGGIRRDA